MVAYLKLHHAAAVSLQHCIMALYEQGVYSYTTTVVSHWPVFGHICCKQCTMASVSGLRYTVTEGSNP
jgi:hypothetical protein